jgi:hypothetical protein
VCHGETKIGRVHFGTLQIRIAGHGDDYFLKVTARRRCIQCSDVAEVRRIKSASEETETPIIHGRILSAID